MYVSPLAAMFRGALAGAAGALAQNQFFKLVKAPDAAPRRPFEPPEPKQATETSVQTVARRYYEGLMARPPLSDAQKARGGQIVHYAFGADWGAFYGAARETFPSLVTPLGIAGFSLAVWGVSDNFLLPFFRLADWPQAYPLKTHAYAATAHLVYGAAVAATYEVLRRGFGGVLAAGLVAVGLRAQRRRRFPAAVRPAARRFIDGLSSFSAASMRRVGAIAQA